ncbi:MAG: spore maturation protein A [Oscillospiraceae bacterium]|nr:spore maturation protein A [Oscillospiraceae bacterium]
MAMSFIWVFMILLSVGSSFFFGTGEQVSKAALEGAAEAVQLCLSMAGILCLWSGIMEVMRRSGLMGTLSRILRPILALLYPQFKHDNSVMEPLSANVSANLLGLGNAATPMGIQAATQMNRTCPGVATDPLCMLVVCNTASIQLIPATIAGVRAAAGAAAPFDILPAVWLASVCSVLAGISAAKLFQHIWRDSLQ